MPNWGIGAFVADSVRDFRGEQGVELYCFVLVLGGDDTDFLDLGSSVVGSDFLVWPKKNGCVAFAGVGADDLGALADCSRQEDGGICFELVTECRAWPLRIPSMNLPSLTRVLGSGPYAICTILDAGFLPRFAGGLFSTSCASSVTALDTFGFGGDPIVPVLGLNCNSFLGFAVSATGFADAVVDSGTQPLISAPGG
jgi:hypothetical protein